MNRRLLLSLAVGLSSVSSFAYNVGDYIFTSNAKFKVSGENLIQNGSFTNNYDSWTQLDGTSALSPDFWSVEANAGPNGESVLQSVSNADENTGAFVLQGVDFEASKSYVVSLKVYSPEAITTATTSTSANYLDVYANDGSSTATTAPRFQRAASLTGIPANKWTDVSFAFTDTVTGGSTGKLYVAFGRMTPGVQITDVEIHEVAQVYDTRLADRQLAYDKKLLALDILPEGKENLQQMIELLEASLTGQSSDVNIDDVASMTDFMTQIKEAETAYLNANSFDLINGDPTAEPARAGFTNNNPLWGTKVQKANGNYGDWFCGGSGRWFHDPSGSEEVRDYITSGYALGAGYMGIHKALPAGKYMFQIEAMGVTYMNGKGADGKWTTPDFDTPVMNRLFLGTDTLTADTLSPNDYRTYYIIADVPAGTTADELNLTAGVIHDATTHGGTFSYRNPVLRLISPTAYEDINKFVADNNKAVQLKAANDQITAAETAYADTQYPWGKAQLQEAINKNKADRDAMEATESTTLLEVVGQPGQTTTVADSLNNIRANMKGSVDAYKSENSAYTSLVAAVAAAQAQYDDPANAKASAATKSSLKAALDNGNTTIATFAAQTDSLEGDLAKSKELVEALATAVENFTATTASLANPSDIAIVNPLFQSNRNGWDTTGSESGKGFWQSNSKWKNVDFEGGLGINMWRGYTAYPKNVVRQTVTLTHAGAYEFSCQARAYNENGGRDGDMTGDNHIYYFAKLVSEADSIGAVNVHTNRSYVDTLGYGGNTPEYFVIVYNKTTDTPEDISFGFDATQNSSSNQYQFGGNHIRYMGDFAAYQADVKTALTDSIAEAQKILVEYKDSIDKKEYKALNNAVLCAQSAIDGTTLAFPITSSLKAPYAQSYVGYVAPEATSSAKRRATTADASAQKTAVMAKALKTLARAKSNFKITPVSTGIEGIHASQAVKANANGVYNLAGQKVAETTKNLGKGLYIVNGKKVVVK